MFRLKCFYLNIKQHCYVHYITGIIADMSLGIRQGVDNFKIKHMPTEKLKVRIGVHTGSCCAGLYWFVIL